MQNQKQALNFKDRTKHICTSAYLKLSL